MKRILPIAALALATLTLAGAASADTPRVNRRQACQNERIVQGVKSGALTQREAMRLRRGQAHVRRMEWRAKADGRVTASERRMIRRAQDTQSARIYRLKHNHRV